VEFYLADACFDYNTLIEDIKENKLHPSRNHKPKERIAFLQKLADEQVDCIRKVIADLKKLK
jgi:signal transduction histidine kinase